MFKRDGWYRFRNIFKNRFSSLQMKTITPNVVIVYGTLKENGMPNVRVEKGIEILSITEGNGGTTREEVSVQTMSKELSETTANPRNPDDFYCGNEIESPSRTMMECRIIEPDIPIINNNTCRICGQQKSRKEFRKIWSLRKEPSKEIRLWCKDCQTLWKKSRTFPTTTSDKDFVVLLD